MARRFEAGLFQGLFDRGIDPVQVVLDPGLEVSSRQISCVDRQLSRVANRSRATGDDDNRILASETA